MKQTKGQKAIKAIRTGNRCGKTTMGMADEQCDEALLGPRRSIPIAEVNEMIDQVQRQIKAELTIYDDRAVVLERLESNENDIEYLESRLHQMRLDNKGIRAELNRVNLAIVRQLEPDGE